MKNFIMTAMAVVLFSATANANTISVKCGDYVQRGTVKLANPPVMNCADLELLQKYLGSGITVGPDSKVEELVAAITSIQPAPKAQPVPPVTTEKFVVTENNLKLEDSGVNIRREDTSKSSSDWPSELGGSLVAGIVIALLAMLLDRITSGLATKSGTYNSKNVCVMAI